MLSRSLASGAMLVTVVTLSGFAVLDAVGPDTSNAVPTEIAIVEKPAPAAAAEATPRPASAPQRVVDAAGFPVVPDALAATRTAEVEAPTGPTVTINGRPLGETWEPARNAVAETAPAPEAPVEVALAEELVAPTPIRRPAELELPRVDSTGVASAGLENVGAESAGVDYEAITASAYPDQDWSDFSRPEPVAPVQAAPRPPELVGPVGVVPGFMNWAERERFANAPSPSPSGQGLVQVVGPNGQALWVYPDQVGQFERAPARTSVDPFAMFLD